MHLPREPPEAYFRNLLFIIFRLVGFYCEVEHPLAGGRSDMVIKTDKYIYVMEFKHDGTAKAAMKQIKDNGYAEPFKSDGRKIVLVGANFASDMAKLDGVLVE